MGNAKLAPIESEFNGLKAYSDDAEEVATFVRIMRSFLTINPTQRPRAAEALLDPAFRDL